MDRIEINKFIKEFIEFMQNQDGHKYLDLRSELLVLNTDEQNAALLDIIIISILMDGI